MTDDPGAPGNRHWEINFGWEADRNPANARKKQTSVTLLVE